MSVRVKDTGSRLTAPRHDHEKVRESTDTGKARGRTDLDTTIGPQWAMSSLRMLAGGWRLIWRQDSHNALL